MGSIIGTVVVIVSKIRNMAKRAIRTSYVFRRRQRSQAGVRVSEQRRKQGRKRRVAELLDALKQLRRELKRRESNVEQQHRQHQLLSEILDKAQHYQKFVGLAVDLEDIGSGVIALQWGIRGGLNSKPVRWSENDTSKRANGWSVAARHASSGSTLCASSAVSPPALCAERRHGARLRNGVRKTRKRSGNIDFGTAENTPYASACSRIYTHAREFTPGAV